MHVLFCCNTGVTTSLLVAKIKNELAARDPQITISAEPLSEAMQHLSDADCILLSPQVGFAQDNLVEVTTKPIATIDPDIFGRADVSAMVDLIESLLANKSLLFDKTYQFQALLDIA